MRRARGAGPGARRGRRAPGAVHGAVLAAALAAAACVPRLGEPRAPGPTVGLPDGFAGAAAPPTGAVPITPLAARTWAEFFDDPRLVALIGRAIGANQDLNLQLQDIVIARSEASARLGARLPRLDAQLGAGIEKVGEHTSQGRSDRALGLADPLGDFRFGLVGSWEADVFGRLRAAQKAAGLRVLASREARHFLITQIVGELARAYYELVALDNQLGILAANLQLQASALETVRLEKQAARVTELAVQRFEAELAKLRARVFHLEQARVAAENRINFLVGRFPQPVERDPSALERPLGGRLGAGLPAALLANRPDVREAELQLGAARMDVGSTRAAFFPSLSIDLGLGYRAFNPSHLLLTPASTVANLAGNLVAPLLNRRAIAAAYRTANAQQVQAVVHYEQVVLAAYTEVVNQLARADNLEQSLRLQAEQVAILGRAVETSTWLFQSAEADYMEVLLTRRDSLDAQLELVETRRRQFHAMADLYQALGGGWREAPPPCP